MLAGDGCEKGNPTQAHLHYSGNWGHDHHDMLNFILWACGDELIPDIGYTWTYRMFTTNSSGHNLVVVDRGNQGRVGEPGRLIGWHPAEDDVQVAEVSAPSVYPQCSVYRRAIFLVPTGGRDQVVLDIFEVAGGDTHEWMAHGACSSGRGLEVSVPTHFHAESYADDGQPFTPPAHSEWEKELNAQGLQPWRVDPWYGVFRGVHRGRVEGPFTATFRPADRSLPGVRLHMVAPTRISVEGRSAFSYRPRMVAWGDGVYLVWDGYVDGVYDVYGCPVSQAGPSAVVRISRDASWENKPAICRDRDGGLWAVWVRWQDVRYRFPASATAGPHGEASPPDPERRRRRRGLVVLRGQGGSGTGHLDFQGPSFRPPVR